MASPLKRVLRYLVYAGSAVIIVLAVLVGLFRLLLPQLPEYQQEIQQRLSAVLGQELEFERLDARWRFSGPELIAKSVTLRAKSGGEQLASADEIVVGASVVSLLRERRLVPNRVVARGVKTRLERDAEGIFNVNGIAVDDLLPKNTQGAAGLNIRLLVEDSLVQWRDVKRTQTWQRLRLQSAEVSRQADRRRVELNFSADRDTAEVVHIEFGENETEAANWTVFVTTQGLDVSDFGPLLAADLPLTGSGTISLEWWLELSDRAIGRSNATVELIDVGVRRSRAAEEPIAISGAGKIEWTGLGRERLAGFAIDSLRIGESQWSPSDGEVRLLLDADGNISAADARASYINLGDISSFQNWFGDTPLAPLADYEVLGALEEMDASVEDLNQASMRYTIAGRARNLHFVRRSDGVGIRGLSGSVNAEDTSGSVRFESEALGLSLPAYFATELDLGAVSGGVTWRSGSRGLAILSDNLVINNPIFSADSSFELQIVADVAPRLDLATDFAVADVAGANAYLPSKVMAPLLVKWFGEALVSGALENGKLVFDGAMDQFPFRDQSGVFHVEAEYVDGELAFNGRWPSAKITRALISLDGLRLESKKNTGAVLGNRARNVFVAMPDVTRGELIVRSKGQSDVSDALELVQRSSLRNLVGDRIDSVDGSGVADYTMDLFYPLRDRKNFTVETKIELTDARFTLAPFTQEFSQVSGVIDVSRTTLSADGLSGELLGAKLAVELLRAAPESGYSVVAIASGPLANEGLREEFKLPALDALSGTSDVRATLRFPARAKEGVDPRFFRLRLESDLVGSVIDAPRPLGKRAEQEARLQFDVSIPQADTIDLAGRFANAGSWVAKLMKTDNAWALDRAGIELGAPNATLPVGVGLYVSGATPGLDVNEWLAFAPKLSLAKPGSPILRGMDVELQELVAYGQRADGVELKLDRNANDWLIQVNSERIAGGIFVPLDLSSGRPVVLQMDRLRLTEAVEDDDGKSDDPSRLPPIIVKADNFQLGRHAFGSLDADFEATDNGLVARHLRTSHPSFSTEGGGSWTIDDNGDQLTSFSTQLVSTNTRATSTSLAIDSSIDAADAVAKLDLSWTGPPRRDFFDALDGEVSIRIGNGRLDDVDPGAGRVVGLMSIVELPRRLALDFRDVFSKGLAFNKITADYRIVNGEALTCNLSLEGPSADIALVGRIGLSRRNYNQTAVVRANVGNTLPAVGAVVGGPQVAAAMLLVSRIFKKPLQDIGQVYYQVNGSWDDPSIERTTVERFYATSQLADCLQTLP